jgi:hypothetical protein
MIDTADVTAVVLPRWVSVSDLTICAERGQLQAGHLL